MTDLHDLVAVAGRNDLPYLDPHLPDRPILLRAARPRRFDADTPVLFAHHGVNRNGGDYRDFWLPLVDEAGVLVIVPEFPAAHFPGAAWYNFGNRADEAGQAKPREEWTYGVDERLFAALCAAGVTRRPTYGLWGHSAGGQFVHRMVSLGFRDAAVAAVTANAGTYAMPDLDTGFPYGLGNTGLDAAALRGLLGFPLTVMAGTADTDTASEHFPREPAAMRQGDTRYARAHNYLAAAQATATELATPCAWRIIDVPGVGHDGERMAAAAAPVLAAALGPQATPTS
jgi:hypothetical protein